MLPKKTVAQVKKAPSWVLRVITAGMLLAALMTGCAVAKAGRAGRPAFAVRDGKGELTFGVQGNGFGVKFLENAARIGQVYLYGGASGGQVRWGGEPTLLAPVPCIIDAAERKGRLLIGRTEVLCENGNAGMELIGADESGAMGISVVLRDSKARLRIGRVAIAAMPKEDKVVLGERQGLFSTKQTGERAMAGLVLPRAWVSCVERDVAFGVFRTAWDKVEEGDLAFLARLSEEVIRSF